ncbi:ubiquitin conjugation factor E4 A-like protein [Perkinsela sp. CCAP 1560/4]|nr:ubiquitin conjugation factor E4 A-like protein [Perkinsela sp. CCAP 1560/4]|eukprot:KNH09113.1 ubiquitin conjugation factor E4 A-like protein [Perkinsela sp. CCAP 1560/4]
MTSHYPTARDLFADPEGEIIMFIERGFEMYFGQTDIFCATIREIYSISAGETTSDGEGILSPSAYLALEFEDILSQTELKQDELIPALVEVIRAVEAKTDAQPEWKKCAFVTEIPNVLISCFIDNRIRSLHVSPRGLMMRLGVYSPVAFYRVLAEDIANCVAKLSGPKSTSFANHIIDLFTEELAAIGMLEVFLAAVCHLTFSTQKVSAAIIENMMQAKSPRVLRAFLRLPSANSKSRLDWHTNLPPLAEFTNRSVVEFSRTIIPEAQLWKDGDQTAYSIKVALQATFVEAVGLTFNFVRHTLIPFDRDGTIQWLDEALVAQSEWTKERAIYSKMCDPSIAINLANVSFLLLQPMQNDDRKNLPRIPIEALYHSSCIVRSTVEKAADGPPPPTEFHFTANLFFLGLKYLHLIAGMIAKGVSLTRSFRLQSEILRMDGADFPEENPTEEQSNLYYQRKMLNLFYRQQMSIYALLMHQKTMDNMRGMVLFVARWLIYVAIGETSVRALAGKSPLPAWKFVCQDVFWDIARVIEHCILFEAQNVFTPAEIEYWIRFVTAFVVDTSLMTNKHHRGSYAVLLRQLCLKCNYLMDEDTCENVVRTVLRMYVDLESLGESKYTPRHHLNILLNILCKKRRSTIEYIRRRACDEDNEDFVKFISYIIADANLMLDNSILTLKSMNASFLRDGDGGEPAEYAESETGEGNDFEEEEESYSGEEGGDSTDAAMVSLERTRSRRIESLQFYMDFTNRVLLLLRKLCQEIPESLMHSLVSVQVTYTLDYFLTQLAGPRMQEIAKVPVKVLEEGRFDHRGIVEHLIHCYVGIAKSCRREDLKNAMCSDGHYYSPAAFREIIRFLEEKAVSPETVVTLKLFFTEVESCFQIRKREDDLFSDPPNEFVCQITYELLQNPLILPGIDHVWVESKSILHHLLFDETNPFNRQALTSAELLAFNALPENRTRAEVLVRDINQWKSERRSSDVSGEMN